MKPLFIHIPKAAGMVIQKIVENLNEDMGPSNEVCLHKKVTRYRKSYRDRHYVFSFVRNPFDRLVSAYFFLKAGGIHRHDRRRARKLANDFNTFVKEDLLSKPINRILHFHPMVHWLDAEIDFIGKFENLQEDFNTICDKIGIPQQKLPHKNATKHKHYTEYYDDETRKIVAEKYAKDIEYFGYEFGE